MVEDKLCAYEFCRKPFTPLKRWQIYCCRSCTNAAYYHRRAKRSGLDLLAEEVSNGPSEAQIADRERRIKESLYQREMDEELENMAKRKYADDLMKQAENRGFTLETIGYKAQQGVANAKPMDADKQENRDDNSRTSSDTRGDAGMAREEPKPSERGDSQENDKSSETGKT